MFLHTKYKKKDSVKGKAEYIKKLHHMHCVTPEGIVFISKINPENDLIKSTRKPNFTVLSAL